MNTNLKPTTSQSGSSYSGSSYAGSSYPGTSNPETFRSGTVAILGPVNAGKSTLLNQVIGEKVSIVSDKPHTTRNRIAGIKNRENSQLVFFDTPGFLSTTEKIKTKNSMFSEYLESSYQSASGEADLLIWMLDGALILKNKNWRINKDLSFVVSDFEKAKLSLPKIILINKIDIFEKEEILALISALDHEFQKLDISIDFMPVSAKTGDGVKEFLNVLESKLPVGEALFPEGLNSLQTDEQRASEIIREKLFQQLHQELPYGAAVVVEEMGTEGKMLKIFARVIVEKNSHKGVVIGHKGSRLSSIGKAARLELEELFKKKVFLKLFVKVEPNWRRTVQGLEKVELLSNSDV